MSRVDATHHLTPIRTDVIHLSSHLISLQLQPLLRTQREKPKRPLRLSAMMRDTSKTLACPEQLIMPNLAFDSGGKRGAGSPGLLSDTGEDRAPCLVLGCASMPGGVLAGGQWVFGGTQVACLQGSGPSSTKDARF